MKNIKYSIIFFVTVFISSATFAQMSGIKIGIDPGHGGSDPGALGYNGSVWPDEADIVLAVSKEIQQKFQNLGANVVMTRTTDQYFSLTYRRNLMNQQNPDAYVSVHENSFTSSSANGTETFRHTSNGGSNSISLATKVQAKMVDDMGFRDRGVKYAYFTAISVNSSIPAALTEGCFLSNPTEWNYITQSSNQICHANAIKNGILHYLNFDYLIDLNCNPVSIPTAAPSLISPSNGASGQSTTGTNFSWGNVQHADQYRLQIATSVAGWSAANGFSSGNLVYNQNLGGATNITMQGFASCTTYYWTVRGGNDNGGGPFASPRSFTTNGCSSYCESPTINGYPKSSPCGHAYLYWSNISSANSYNLYYWNNGWKYFHNTSNTGVTVSLPSNATFYFAVRAVCGTNNLSLIENYVTINTPNCRVKYSDKELTLQSPQNNTKPVLETGRIQAVRPSPKLAALTNLAENSIILYPNPNNGFCKFGYKVNKEVITTVSIFDVNGKTIKTIVNQFKEPGQYYENLSLFDLDNGIYLIQLKMGEEVITKKMILNK